MYNEWIYFSLNDLEQCNIYLHVILNNAVLQSEGQWVKPKTV